MRVTCKETWWIQSISTAAAMKHYVVNTPYKLSRLVIYAEVMVRLVKLQRSGGQLFERLQSLSIMGTK